MPVIRLRLEIDGQCAKRWKLIRMEAKKRNDSIKK